MAILNIISVPQAIKELRDWIKCEWCGNMARGLAENDAEESLPSCGSKDCGYEFQSGEGNSFFQTRDNLLEIAERCYRAERTLAELTVLAKKCEDRFNKVDTPWNDLLVQGYARNLCKEVIAADYESTE